MKLTPLQDWAVIKPSMEHSVTAGGLYIPDMAKEKQAQGQVEAIGPGALEEEGYGKKKKARKDRKFIPTTIKPGDFVVYEQYAGQTYKVGAEDRILVRERDILGVLPGGAPQDRPMPKPLQLPAATSDVRSTALVSSGTRAVTKPGTKAITTVPASARKEQGQAAQSTKKAAKKAVKKAAKKVAKKAIQKAAKKAKPAATKRKAGKPAKKKR